LPGGCRSQKVEVVFHNDCGDVVERWRVPIDVMPAEVAFGRVRVFR
jgi:hypothetical protein